MRIGDFTTDRAFGYRSVDGHSDPDSEINRRLILAFAIPVIAGVASVAAIAIVLVPITGAHVDGLHLGWALALTSTVLLVPIPLGLLALRRLPAWCAHVILLLTWFTYFPGVALAIGVNLSPFVGLAYSACILLIFVVFPLLPAIAHVAAASLSYGVILAVQRGNTAPLTRWVIVVGWMVIVAVGVSALVARIGVLAAAERAARDEAEQSKQATAELNRTLNERVDAQVAELQRLGRLRRFLSTPVADVVLSADNQSLLAPHRREIAVFFCDLRGFTAFTASTQPEEALAVLDEYFAVLGDLIARHEATVATFTGDGLMAFFNDPLPCPDPAQRAVLMALDLRTAMQSHIRRWNKQGYNLGLASAVAFGYANLGMIGFEGRRDYSAFGLVVNLAARLCAEARSDEVLVDQRALAAIPEGLLVAEARTFTLKGFRDPVTGYCVNPD